MIIHQQETSEIMKYSLENVSALGTGRNAYVDGYRVGGKTGTAQKVGPNGLYMQGNYILSFLGAAPMNDPKAVVYLAIDNPKNTIQYGGVVAAPMVGEIFEQILPLLNVKKEETYFPDDFRHEQYMLIEENGKQTQKTKYENQFFVIPKHSPIPLNCVFFANVNRGQDINQIIG